MRPATTTAAISNLSWVRNDDGHSDEELAQEAARD